MALDPVFHYTMPEGFNERVNYFLQLFLSLSGMISYSGTNLKKKNWVKAFISSVSR